MRFFDFTVHYDGSFAWPPLRYERGIEIEISINKLSYDELVKELEKRCACTFNSIYFLIPGNQLSGGLIKIDSQKDVDCLFDIAYSYGQLVIYVDHFLDDLTEFLAIPANPNQGDVVDDEGNTQFNVSDYLISQSQPRASLGATSLGAASQKTEKVEMKKKDVEGKGKEKVVIEEHVGGDENEDNVGGNENEDNVGGNDNEKNVGQNENEENVGHNENEDNVGDNENVDNVGENENVENVGENENVDNVGENENDSSEDDDYEPSDSDTESEVNSVDNLSEGEDELREFRLLKKANKNKPKSKRQPKLGDPAPRVNTSNHDLNDAVCEHEDFMKEWIEKLKGSEYVDEDPFKAIQDIDKWPIHNVNIHWKHKQPVVGERFTDHHQFREMLTYFALANGFSLWFEKSTQKRCVARCGQRPPTLENPEEGKKRKQNRYPATEKGEEPKCPWRCFGKKMEGEDSFQIISLKDEHTCVRNFRFGSLVNYKWIGKRFGDRIRAHPDIKLVTIADMVMKKYKCQVTPNQCRNAKNYALNEYEKSLEEHYGMLRSYGDELLRSNPGSTVKLAVTRDPDDKVYFDKMYICFDALKRGWKHGCRRVIALDGCFLKKPNQGELLSAIGRDGNNHIYPIAWAVVSVENKANWKWFLELLSDDLDIGAGAGITLISDQHKGLIEAVKEVMPNSEHRQCARHIYDGFRKQFSGAYLQGLFWAASKAAYPQLFERIMKQVRDANPAAAQYLIEKNPRTWSRAFFELHRGCENVENGFSECFNYVIVMVRNKPIITMLEAIRTIVLERMNTLRRLASSWKTDICPSIIKRLDWCKDQQRYWKPFHCGLDEWEVRQGNEGFKVNEARRSCSCRMWELTGLPCPHAVSVIFKMARNVEDYVPNWFRKSLYIETYEHYLHPVGGMTTWEENLGNKPLPPKPRVMPGRPKKKRIRASHERHVTSKGNMSRVTKHGVQMRCQRCLQTGHNRKGCQNEPVEKPVKVVMKKMGRPPKNVGQSSSQPVGSSSSQPMGQTSGQPMGQGSQNVGGFSSQNQTAPSAPSPGKWTRIAVKQNKLHSPKKVWVDEGEGKGHFVLGSCTATTKTGVKGPRKLPSASEMEKQKIVEMAKDKQPVQEQSTPKKTSPTKKTTPKRTPCPPSAPERRSERLVHTRRPSERALKRKLGMNHPGPGETEDNAMIIE